MAKTGFNLMDFAASMFSGGMIDKIKGLVQNQLGKFAEKMKPEECLLSVRSGDGKKLLTFRGTFTINADKSITMVRTGILDIGELISKMDPSKLSDDQKYEIQQQLSDDSSNV